MCKGKCQVQLFDVRLVGGTTIRNTLIDKATKQPINVGGNPCSLGGTDNVTDALQPYMVKLEGCEDSACICDPVDDNPRWSDWLTYTADKTIEYPAPGGAGGAGAVCQTTITGSYQVSSAVVDGVCMRTPVAMPPRRKSNRPRPKADVLIIKNDRARVENVSNKRKKRGI